MIRVTAAVGERIRAEAESEDRTYTQVCAEILADYYGLPATNHIEPPSQEPLLMTG